MSELPAWTAFGALPRAHGEPLGRGRLRETAADFQVDEDLGFEPDGEGDHLLLRVRKTDANTDWVARRLAEVAGVRGADVGFAGLKDRHAVTTQWFSLPRPRQAEPDWAVLGAEGIEVLEAHAHRRKLRRGALAGNRFQIRVRGLEVPAEALDERIAAIRARGVPNYFGEQRFGRGGANLARADALFRGVIRRTPRHQRGLWLSAARSQIFNEVLAARVRRGDWDRPLAGDCLNLDGSRAFFAAETIDADILGRVAAWDLHPTGPLWGQGAPPTVCEVLELERDIAGELDPWCVGLALEGLKQERRALRLRVAGLIGEIDGAVTKLSFELSSGSYATAVLRELILWSE